MWSNGFLQRIEVAPRGWPWVLGLLGTAGGVAVAIIWTADLPAVVRWSLLAPALVSCGRSVWLARVSLGLGSWHLEAGADGRCQARNAGQHSEPARLGRAWRCGPLAALELLGPGRERHVIMTCRPGMQRDEWRRLAVRLRHGGPADVP